MSSFVYVRPNVNQPKRFKRWFYIEFNKGLIPTNYKSSGWVVGDKSKGKKGYLGKCPAITLDSWELARLFKEIQVIKDINSRAY